MKSITENSCCPLGCQGPDEEVVIGGDILHGLPGKFTVVKCRSCGLMRTNPRPTQDAISAYYPDDYGPYIGTRVPNAIPKRAVWVRKILKPLISRLFNSKGTFLPSIKPGKMLEIGCASGSYLHQMAGQGWKVQGIEFSEKAAKSATALGYQVYVGSLETAPNPDEAFDLIVGWMVLEHLHDPIACLKKLRVWAKPNAWLALSVPNAGSIEFRIFRDKWYALQLPTHLYHYTPTTIETVLSSAGWTLEKIHHQRVLNNLFVSIGYVLQSKGYSKLGQKFIEFPAHAALWWYILYPLALLLSIFGQTGRMTVWARLSTTPGEIG